MNAVCRTMKLCFGTLVGQKQGILCRKCDTNEQSCFSRAELRSTQPSQLTFFFLLFFSYLYHEIHFVMPVFHSIGALAESMYRLLFISLCAGTQTRLETNLGPFPSGMNNAQETRPRKDQLAQTGIPSKGLFFSAVSFYRSFDTRNKYSSVREHPVK